jgi:hypothetical protein
MRRQCAELLGGKHARWITSCPGTASAPRNQREPAPQLLQYPTPRARCHAPHGIRLETFDEVGELPHFSQDLEDNTPSAGTALRAAIETADVLLVASPEYNSAMPGVLKDVLDWASRPAGRSVLADKPAAALDALARSKDDAGFGTLAVRC